MTQMCSYTIPSTGKRHWQAERACRRPAADGDDRCKTHERRKLLRTRERQYKGLMDKCADLYAEIKYMKQELDAVEYDRRSQSVVDVPGVG